jgi:hypothetical protein
MRFGDSKSMTMAFLLSHILKSVDVFVTSVLINFLSQKKKRRNFVERINDIRMFMVAWEKAKIFEMFLFYNTQDQMCGHTGKSVHM